ncbi:hypothetical protein [Azonexus hydrophilus]|uniref:hypothetical protein n=1 Tax=Azonexus hydrophilus TaxID=418702 RepID=UPI00041AAC26|nr:hypothetical protein [Azonexus hydrophilus]
MWAKIVKSKTIIFGFVIMLLGAIQTYLPNLQAALDPVTYGIATAVVGVLIIVLRFFTTIPVSEK